MQVMKRNGTLVEFDKVRIENAINAAFLEVDGKLYETDTAYDIASDIEKKIKKAHTDVSVETIQDWIEDYLMRSERRDVARAYIRYRYKKEVARNYSDEFMKAVGEKLQAKKIANQNANVDEASFGGRVGEAAAIMTKQYALDYLVSKLARENHLGNMIYLHDLDSYCVGSHNCLSIPFDDLLAKGFNTRQTDVRPAGSINTAFQLVAVIFQLQSLQQFGGVSATHLDWTMIPYVRKSFAKHYRKGLKYFQDYDIDYSIEFMLNNAKEYSIHDSEYKAYNEKAYEFALDLTDQELHQAAEGLYHNLNTL